MPLGRQQAVHSKFSEANRIFLKFYVLRQSFGYFSAARKVTPLEKVISF